jgi:hypothetical protein
MKSKPQPAPALPKARACFANIGRHFIETCLTNESCRDAEGEIENSEADFTCQPVAVIPFRTQRQARAACKWARLNREEKVERMAAKITVIDSSSDIARAILDMQEGRA